jgi:N-acetylglutamate synthase-like GNAT family acetyltransferase
MDDYQLRVANLKDTAAVEKVLKASYPILMAVAYDKAVLTPVLKLITKANNSLLTSGTYYVAETDEGLMVGCGGWTIEKPPGADDVGIEVGHLRHFGTSPDWTRRGIGRAIFQQCESTAKSTGVKELEVCSSLNAEQFYAALGFKRIKIISVAIGPNQFPSVLMRMSV